VITTSFKDLSSRERFLTIAAFIAFPVDVVALLGLLSQVFKFQKINPSIRPDAIQIGLPSFLWDTRIADALSISILFYSMGVLLYLRFRWGIASLQKQIKETENVNQSMLNSEELKDKKIHESLLTALPIMSWFLPLFLIWTRVFLILSSSFFIVGLLTVLSLIIFNQVYFSGREDSKPFEGSIPSELRKRVTEGFPSKIWDAIVWMWSKLKEPFK